MAALWAGSPASYTKGRARPVQYVVLHYTAGSEGPRSAEDGAAYDKRRPDGTSSHYFTDSLGPPVQEVGEGDRAHTALYRGNEIGVHIEICGTKQSRAQWLDPVSLATLRTTAELVADICKRQRLTPRRLTVAETAAAYNAAPANRPTGIVDHYTITQAYPADLGDHTDVGPEFPWDLFLTMVGAFYRGEDPDMLTPAQARQAEVDAWRVAALQAGAETVQGGPAKGEKMWVVAALKRAEASAAALTTVAAGLAKAIAAIGTNNPETAAILADVQRQLAEQSRGLAAEIQGTAEAALEAGSAGVRERHPPTATSS